MVKLNFLGRGAAFYPQLGNTNAYFVLNNSLYLLDCGESSFEKLMARLDLTQYDKISVILTHMHADHVGSLGSLLSYCKIVLNKIVNIVYPSKNILSYLKLIGIAGDFYTYTEELPKTENLSIRPLPVKHADDMDCFGYLISDISDTIYYSGDAVAIPPEVLQSFMLGDITHIYQDIASHQSKSHLYYKLACELVPKEHRNRLFCMHLDSDCEKELESLGFSVVKVCS